MMRLWPTALGAKGALFFATVLLLYLATPYSNLFFLLTAFLAVLGLLGAVGAWRNLRPVAAALAQATAAPAGGQHEIELRLSTMPGRRSFGVSAWLEIDGTLHAVGEAALVSDGTTLVGNIVDLPRGVHRIEALRLRSRHPIGVCTAERRVPLDAELVAYPRPATFAGEHRGDDPRTLAAMRALAAVDESIAGLRDWRDGDSRREIHWRATARRGEPVVKERERDCGGGLDVVVDRRCDQATLERALAVATALVLEAADHQQSLRLSSQGFAAVHQNDRPATATMLRWLAGARILPHDAAAPAPVATTAIRLPAAPHGGTP